MALREDPAHPRPSSSSSPPRAKLKWCK